VKEEMPLKCNTTPLALDLDVWHVLVEERCEYAIYLALIAHSNWRYSVLGNNPRRLQNFRSSIPRPQTRRDNAM
jgi:hypothetical protein